jgi:hypothetical protein
MLVVVGDIQWDREPVQKDKGLAQEDIGLVQLDMGQKHQDIGSAQLDMGQKKTQDTASTQLDKEQELCHHGQNWVNLVCAAGNSAVHEGEEGWGESLQSS